jgi:hypothetical protein
MFLKSLAVAMIAVAVAPAAANARPRPGRPGPVPIVQHPGKDEPSGDHASSCRAPAVVCVVKGAARTVVDAVAPGVGPAVNAISAGAGAVAGGVMDGVVSWAADGAASLLHEVAGKVDDSTRPQLGSSWYRREYGSMAELAISLALVFLLLSVSHSLLRQDVTILLRAALMALPLALFLTFAAVALVGLALSLTDSMSATALAAAGTDAAAAMERIARVFLAGTAGQPALAPFVVFLTAVLAALLALAVWLELALREQAVYVATAFLPLTFVAMVWRPTAVWCRRLAEGLTGLILSKFAVAVTFALAAGALGRGGGQQGGLSVVVGGCALLLIAALAPWAIVRLVPFASAGHEQALNRQNVASAVHAAPGASIATGATRLLMYSRFSGVGPAFARRPVEPDAAPPAARRSDVPVAVIPPPDRQGTSAS